MDALVSALLHTQIVGAQGFATQRREAEKAAPKLAVTLYAGRLESYGLDLHQTISHRKKIVEVVLSCLAMGCGATAMATSTLAIAQRTGTSARPSWMIPATRGAAPVAYVFEGDNYDFSSIQALGGSSLPRNQEADAIMSIVCHAILKAPTSLNESGFTVNRLKALSGRAGGDLRGAAVVGANALQLADLQRIHNAFAGNPQARKAVCQIVFNCIVMPTTPMEEAIASQNKLLMGAGVSGVMRASNFVIAFPEVVQMVPQLKREAAKVVSMLQARATEDPLTYAFGPQMYRDLYFTVQVAEARTLITVAVLLERKVNKSADHIVTPLTSGPMFVACEELADAVAKRADAQLKAYGEAATKINA